jgi:hypothetical protein
MRPQLSNKPPTGALTRGHTHYLFLRSLCNEQVAAVAQTQILSASRVFGHVGLFCSVDSGDCLHGAHKTSLIEFRSFATLRESI